MGVAERRYPGQQMQRWRHPYFRESEEAPEPPPPKGPFAELRLETQRRAIERKAWYHFTLEDGGPRVLNWEEARMREMPVGETLRGVVEELRDYGAFVGLIADSK